MDACCGGGASVGVAGIGVAVSCTVGVIVLATVGLGVMVAFGVLGIAVGTAPTGFTTFLKYVLATS
jgi:hypothetical protein